MDAAKLRYSAYCEKDVVIARNFHSIEMMPNGDVVIAESGDDGEIY